MRSRSFGVRSRSFHGFSRCKIAVEIAKTSLDLSTKGEFCKSWKSWLNQLHQALSQICTSPIGYVLEVFQVKPLQDAFLVCRTEADVLETCEHSCPYHEAMTHLPRGQRYLQPARYRRTAGMSAWEIWDMSGDMVCNWKNNWLTQFDICQGTSHHRSPSDSSPSLGLGRNAASNSSASPSPGSMSSGLVGPGRGSCMRYI